METAVCKYYKAAYNFSVRDCKEEVARFNDIFQKKIIISKKVERTFY